MSFVAYWNSRIYLKVTLPIWSCIVSCLYILRYFYRIPEALRKRKESEHNLLREFNLPSLLIQPEDKYNWSLIAYLRTFKFVNDLFYDWFPKWHLVYEIRGRIGDCDDAARAAQWGWNVLGMKSRIVILDGSAGKHAVCVRDDDKYVATNGIIYKLEYPTEACLLSKFIPGYFTSAWGF